MMTRISILKRRPFIRGKVVYLKTLGVVPSSNTPKVLNPSDLPWEDKERGDENTEESGKKGRCGVEVVGSLGSRSKLSLHGHEFRGGVETGQHSNTSLPTLKGSDSKE